MSSSKDVKAVLLSRDLFFSSKVTGAGENVGLPVQVVGDVEQAVSEASADECRCLIIDLSPPGPDVGGILGSLSADNRPRVVAFGSHVHQQLLEQAESAGCDEVLPRSRFTAELPEILKRCLEE